MFPRSPATSRHSAEHLGEGTKFLLFPVLETGRKEFLKGREDNITIDDYYVQYMGLRPIRIVTQKSQTRKELVFASRLCGFSIFGNQNNYSS